MNPPVNKPNVWEALADVFVARREERELADAEREGTGREPSNRPEGQERRT